MRRIFGYKKSLRTLFKHAPVRSLGDAGDLHHGVLRAVTAAAAQAIRANAMVRDRLFAFGVFDDFAEHRCAGNVRAADLYGAACAAHQKNVVERDRGSDFFLALVQLEKIARLKPCAAGHGR